MSPTVNGLPVFVIAVYPHCLLLTSRQAWPPYTESLSTGQPYNANRLMRWGGNMSFTGTAALYYFHTPASTEASRSTSTCGPHRSPMRRATCLRNLTCTASRGAPAAARYWQFCHSVVAVHAPRTLKHRLCWEITT